jgi:hypothetical protein
MPKYVGNSQYDRPKRDFSEKLSIAAEGVSKGLQAYGQMKKAEEAKKILADPSSTPIQKAMALASINQEKLSVESYKKSANESLIGGITQNIKRELNQIRGGGQPQKEASRDRSWVPDMSGRTAPIRDAGPANTAQPGAKGTGSPTQPGFSPGAPQAAARNATALNQEMPNPNMAGSPQESASIPQMSPQEIALAEADAFDRAASQAALAHDLPLQRDFENKANQRRMDVRATIKAESALSHEQKKENRAEITKAFAPYSDLGSIDKLEKDLEEAEDLILNKNVSFDTNILGSALAAIAEGKESGVADLFKTKDQQKLFSVLRSSLKPKTEGGSNPSTREVLLSMSAIPSYMKSKEANAYIVGNLLEDVRLNKIRSKIMNNLRKDPNITAPEFYEQVHQQMQPYLEQSREQSKIRNGMLTATSQVADKSPSPGHLFMYDPKSGDMFEAPVEDRQLLESQQFIVLPSRRSR